jgi:hypothetical protein
MGSEHDHESGERELSDEEVEEQLKAFRYSQQVYLERTFKWLIDYVASYFPEDELSIRDMDMEVHFIHQVMEAGKPLGGLVYRFRKFVDKKDYFKEMAEDYQEGLKLPEVLFVDSETSRFEPSPVVEAEWAYLEIPADKLTGKIRELRDELKRRSKVRQLRDSL